ncbi:hypothetical protein [Sphingomonas sp. DBB INV C78]|uniref:hypothetical protein n=1 Tax=Sphingomonas sp. DBB INV C78 TaxID=3349434 RepID=UPI0036D296D2
MERARARDLDGYAKAIATIPVHRLSTIGNLEPFRQSVAALVPIATSGAPATRLRALALIGRADNTTRQKQEAVATAARAAVCEPPPQFGPEGQEALTSDDRFYISLVIARSDADWVPSYAARALVDEDGQPRQKNDVRKAFADLAFSRSDTLADAFALLARAIPGSLHEDPRTKEAELSRAKRIVKLLPAIEEATRGALSDNGDDLSAAFNDMMQSLIFRYARPITGAESDEAAAGVVARALMLLSTLLRTRFLISVETEAYKTVGRLKYWHKTDSWPRDAAAARRRLEQTLLQAITLRAQTGSASQELLAVLIQLAGDRRRVEPQLARLAEVPGLASEVQDWLRAGGRQMAPRFRTDAAEEAGLRDIDMVLAGSALRALHVQSLADGDVKEALVSMREQRAPPVEIARALVQFLNYSRALANDVLSLSRRRSLSAFGEVGSVVEAVPGRHQREDGQMIVTEMVQIKRAGIERLLPNGTTEVIVPAKVSGVESKRK